MQINPGRTLRGSTEKGPCPVGPNYLPEMVFPFKRERSEEARMNGRDDGRSTVPAPPRGTTTDDGRGPWPAEAREAEASWVPDWCRRVVWYQVFPERFRNGDPRANPTRKDLWGAWPHDHTSPWEVHPWTSDWYELQPWERANGRDVWFNVQRRRYGGDLAGLIERLDYLADLGIGALYLNPVFDSPSLHKYDARVYHHVDPNLGPDPEGDRRIMARETLDDPATWQWTAADRLALELVRRVHEKGMRIIFDGVFNHIGMASPFFLDVARRQQASPYRDWFKVRSWEDPATGARFHYQGWEGHKELPEWRQDRRGLAPGPREYVFAITRRWMDPSGEGRPGEGIDGWRLDVAACVRHAFWKDWAALVRSINPEAYLTAEVIDTVEANRPFLEGDEFTAVMNYNFAFACSEFFADQRRRIAPTRLDARLRELREAYPPAVAYAMQNLLESHDTARFASHVVNRDRCRWRSWHAYCHKALVREGFDGRRPDAKERRRVMLAAIFQMTYVGAPMLYYGEETGMWGGRDPCCRKPMVWPDRAYAPEAVEADGTRRDPPDPVAWDEALVAHHRRLIRLRNARPCLQVGAYETVLADDATGVFAFRRATEAEALTVVLNGRWGPARCVIPAEAGTVYRDLLSGRIWIASAGGIEIGLQGSEGLILERDAGGA